MARKIKKDDTVVVISGADRGKRGRVLRVVDGGRRVVVEKVNVRKHHKRPSQRYPQGGIIGLENPIDISNVMLVSPTTGEPFRVKFKFVEDTTGRRRKVRYNPKTGEVVD